MASKDSPGRVTRIFRPFVNFTHWMDMDGLKQNNRYLWSTIKSLTHTDQSTTVHQESYEQAVSRLGLNEAQLEGRCRQFLLMSIFYGLIALGLVVYAVYLFFLHGLLSALIALAISWVAAVFFFREHFWYTQVKYRRLGLNFQDWLRYTFKRTDSHE